MDKKIENESTHILLISDCMASSDTVERELLGMIDFPCCIWRCCGLAESINALGTENPDFDVVLVDSSIVCTGRPRKIFRQMENVIKDIPIIVFNGSVAHDLSLFLIKEGAADTITQDQAESDPDRLRSAIENAMIRRKTVQRRRQNDKEKIAEIKAQGKADLGIANGNAAATLKKSEESAARELREKEQVINWLSGGYSVER